MSVKRVYTHRVTHGNRYNVIFRKQTAILYEKHK